MKPRYLAILFCCIDIYIIVDDEYDLLDRLIVGTNPLDPTNNNNNTNKAIIITISIIILLILNTVLVKI